MSAESSKHTAEAHPIANDKVQKHSHPNRVNQSKEEFDEDTKDLIKDLAANTNMLFQTLMFHPKVNKDDLKGTPPILITTAYHVRQIYLDLITPLLPADAGYKSRLLCNPFFFKYNDENPYPADEPNPHYWQNVARWPEKNVEAYTDAVMNVIYFSKELIEGMGEGYDFGPMVKEMATLITTGSRFREMVEKIETL